MFVCAAGGDLQLQPSTDPQTARQSSSHPGAVSSTNATWQQQQIGHHGGAEGPSASAFATAQQQVHSEPSGTASRSGSGSSEASPGARRQVTQASMQEQPHDRRQQQQVSRRSPADSAAGLSYKGI